MACIHFLTKTDNVFYKIPWRLCVADVCVYHYICQGLLDFLHETSSLCQVNAVNEPDRNFGSVTCAKSKTGKLVMLAPVYAKKTA